jgi:hypothetical protein
VHVTLRTIDGLCSLRDGSLFAALRRALTASSKPAFRVAHFSVQTNHIHLLVEADAGAALRHGMQGLAIRLAKAVNRALRRRGRVWSDRYHGRALRTPREVRNCLVYVLLNGRKHGVSAAGIDPCSSAAWFTGWNTDHPERYGRPVVRPRTWLLRVGWRRGGRIGIDSMPAENRTIAPPRGRRARPLPGSPPGT